MYLLLYDILFQIGGYLGLLLGYSLYHFAQTIQAVIEKKIGKWKDIGNEN